MPVNISSRYRGLPIIEAADAEGKRHATVATRPHREDRAPRFQYRLAAPETIESLAWRQFSNSTAWWRIADVNPLVFPLDWKPGEAVKLPSTQEAGKVERRRRL